MDFFFGTSPKSKYLSNINKNKKDGKTGKVVALELTWPNISKVVHERENFIKKGIDKVKHVSDSIVNEVNNDFKKASNFLKKEIIDPLKKVGQKIKETIKNDMNKAGKIIKDIVDLNENENKNKKFNMFLSVPYFKASDADELLIDEEEEKNNKLKNIKEKRLMAFIGEFLVKMYKGLDESTNSPAPSLEGSFHPELQFKQASDVYLYINKDKKGAYLPFIPNPYFEIKPEFISYIKSYSDRTLTNLSTIKKMDELLVGTFYEFIFKSVNFDSENSYQFKSLKEMSDHKFLKSKELSFEKLQSDTSSGS